MLHGRVSGLTVGCAVAVAAFAASSGGQTHADTLESALVQAYQNNPTLNSQRSGVRATDENVPIALSGYRPRVTVNAFGGEQILSSTTRSLSPPVSYFTMNGHNA